VGRGLRGGILPQYFGTVCESMSETNQEIISFRIHLPAHSPELHVSMTLM